MQNGVTFRYEIGPVLFSSYRTKKSQGHMQVLLTLFCAIKIKMNIFQEVWRLANIPTWFKFKDKLSSDFGIVVSNYPIPPIPAEKVSSEEIMGRSGTVTITEGEDVFKSISLTIDCFILEGTSARDQIVDWMRGSGYLILGNDPTKRYYGRLSNQIDISQIVRGDNAVAISFIFSCQPYRYEADPQDIVLSVPSTIENPSYLASDPIIKISGVGNVSISIGDYSVSVSSLSGTVTLDCDAKQAYSSTSGPVISLGDDGEWPKLVSGSNYITWSGGISSVTISPNWRWL